MGRTSLVCLAVCVSFLSGCSTTPDRSASSDTSPTATQQGPSQVKIPAMRLDREVDQTYEIQDTASVINDVWYDGTFGKVSVMAKRGDSTGNRTPLLTGTLKMADGATVVCKQFRSTIWSNFDSFEALDLRCTNKLDLSTVQSVDVISAHGAAEQERLKPGG